MLKRIFGSDTLYTWRGVGATKEKFGAMPQRSSEESRYLQTFGGGVSMSATKVPIVSSATQHEREEKGTHSDAGQQHGHQGHHETKT